MSKVSTQKAKVHIINTHLFLKFMKGWSDKKNHKKCHYNKNDTDKNAI